MTWLLVLSYRIWEHAPKIYGEEIPGAVRTQLSATLSYRKEVRKESLSQKRDQTKKFLTRTKFWLRWLFLTTPPM